MSRPSLIHQLIVLLLGVIALNRNGNYVAAFAPVRTSVVSRSNTNFVVLPKKNGDVWTKDSFTVLKMSEQKSNLPMLLDPGTKGGALFLSLVLFIVPIIGYEIATIGFGIDGIEAGKWIGVGFTVVTCLLWFSTYLFRVATKDMTYVSIYIYVANFIIFTLLYVSKLKH